MSQASLHEVPVFEPTADSEPNTRPASEPSHKSSNSKAAIRRCVAAFERTYAEYMTLPDSEECVFDGQELAGRAYCNAMPILDGYNGVREFIACAAHGILIGAISKEQSGQLMSAARVAARIVQQEPGQPKPRSKKNHLPENPPFETRVLN